MSLDVHGVYRQCPQCQAPIMRPFPTGWHLDFVKDGPRHGPIRAYMTPHDQQCASPLIEPTPGIAIRISGEYVLELGVDFGRH